MDAEAKELTVRFVCEKCGRPLQGWFLPHHKQDKIHCVCGVVYTVPRPTWKHEW